jgi:protein involved in polysaccharide export with SLBB domain
MLASILLASLLELTNGQILGNPDPTLAALASASGSSASSGKNVAFPIVDSLFFLSPGDKVRLRWWGTGKGEEELVVSPSYSLLVPEMGRIDVRGIPLDRVRLRVDSLLRRNVRPSLVEFEVVDPVDAMVQVTGNVSKPGISVVPSGTRLSSLLSSLGLDVLVVLRSVQVNPPLREGERMSLPSLRRVRLIRGGSRDTVHCDLLRSILAGDLSQDPPLYSGDKIEVLLQGQVIGVSGQAPNAGFLEFLEGETVGQFLSAIGVSPPFPKAETNGSDGLRRPLEESEVVSAGMGTIWLPGVSRPERVPMVWVQGFVPRPGGYPLRPGARVEDILRSAGLSQGRTDSSVAVPVKRGWNWLQPGRVGSGEQSTLAEVKLALSEYRSQSRGNYSDPNPVLSGDDSIVVLRVDPVVWVGGQVIRPGFVPWVPGNSHRDYVQAAGGYSNSPWKDRTTVLDIFTEQAVPLSQPIRPGSAVIVPERRYIYPEQWITLSATVISVIFGGVAIYLQASAR